MLEEIQASAAEAVAPCHDPFAPSFVAAPEARLAVRGHTPDELLPALNVALAQRFWSAPARHVLADLLEPLKKGVGNAYKWGNGRDRDKYIAVDVTVTAVGAVVAVTDQGSGFDVQDRVGRLRDGRHYYSHGGSGLARFEETRSLISYADGGRTLLIRFLGVPEPGRAPSDEQRSTWGAAADPEAITSLLAHSMPDLLNGTARLEACRIFIPDEAPTEAPQIGYLLRFRLVPSGQPVQEVLTGLRYPPHGAVVARSVTGQLGRFGSVLGNQIRIPEPVAALEEPPVVLFRFNPQLNLRDYLKEAPDPRLLEQLSASVGAGLRALHDSGVTVAAQEGPAESLDRLRAVGADVIDTLASAGDDERRDAAQRLLGQLEAAHATIGPFTPRPIHGSFDFRHVVRSQELFYLCGFDCCRMSHPGFDVGAFLADLRRFAVLSKGAHRRRHEAARRCFLSSYGGDRPPSWLDEAPFFEAFALLLRTQRLLKRPRKKWKRKIDRLLKVTGRVLAEGN